MRKKTTETLTDEERLRLFSLRWHDMYYSRAYQSGLNLSYSVNASTARGVSYNFTEPDFEDFRSFLTVFRKFISIKSPIFIPKTFNSLERLITDGEDKNELRKSRKTYNEVQQDCGFPVSIAAGGKILTQQYVIDMWLNGFYFHDDSEKIKTLDSLEPFHRDATKAVFTDYVIEITKVIEYLARNIFTADEHGLLQVTQPGKLCAELEMLANRSK
jgi:hypothetical protein